MSRFDNIVFDLDGTLCDTAEDIVTCLEKAYDAAGFGPVRIPKEAIGPPLEEMVPALTPGITSAIRILVVEQFRKEYDACDYSATRLNKGACEVLALARVLGMKICVVTNKPYRPTVRILEKLNVRDLDDVLSPDLFQPRRGKIDLLDHLLNKWEMDRGRTLYVGDTASDIEAARGNSVVSVFVSGGYGNLRGIADKPPDHRIRSLVELQYLLMS